MAKIPPRSVTGCGRTDVLFFVVNTGSSSIRLSAIADNAVVESLHLDVSDGALERGVREMSARSAPPNAFVHRVVHGGERFTAAVLVDERTRRELEALVDLAPLHLPRSLRGIDDAQRLLPDVPSYACFDTAFHAGIPPAASTYALPAEWRRRWHIRRYGFHGISHKWASARVAAMYGEPIEDLRIVTCHLGAGASLAAVLHAASVDTTMGFTPLEGLVMATRAGSVDPGLVLWLEQHERLPPAELAYQLEHRSGLLGLSGTADMKVLLERESRGDPDCRLAIDVYLHSLRGQIASMAASMDGIDALAFTGGVGEQAPSIRWRAAEGISLLGVRLERQANETARVDSEITGSGASVRTFVVAAREDLQMAAEVSELIEGAGQH
jgi:acetate kinase